MNRVTGQSQSDFVQNSQQPGDADSFISRCFVAGTIFVIAAWLGAAACSVQIEYYDGLSAIVNARYFLGTVDRYVADRAPLMGLLLMPAEMVRTALGLHPLEVRPYHLELAILHTAYLIVAYLAMSRVFGHSWSVFTAWLAAVPNFVFVSYSPFVSHDIIPGVLLICMLLWCDRFSRNRSLLLWTGLVTMGTVAALMKQTFGIFWVLLMLASLFHWNISKSKEDRATFMALACGAFASGAITWFAMGYLLGNADPHSPLLMRPLRNLQYLSNVYQGMDVVFPLWIYLRNASTYGWLALVLVVPGWVMSIRGTRIQQSMAIAWLGGLVFLHLLPLREVRYMAFLSPVTACLLVPPLRLLAERKTALVAALLVLALDVGRCTLEAGQVFHSFYTTGIERRFLDLLDDPESRTRPVFVNAPMMSFVSPIPSPMAADRYHRVFHFGVVHLRYLYGCRDLQIIADDQGALRSASTCPDGSLLFFTNNVLARGPSWLSGSSIIDASFTQSAAICRSQAVRLLDVAENALADSDAVMLSRASASNDGALVIAGDACSETSIGELLPVLQIKSTGKSFLLRRSGPRSYSIPGMQPPDPIVGSLEAKIRRFEIDRRIRFDTADVEVSHE